MAIECDKCQRENPDDSRFCNHCGEKLPLEAAGSLAINEREVGEQTQSFVKQFADNIKLVAAQTKMEALEDFQDRATRWVKVQFITATAAISILIAFLALLGYNGWDLNEKFQQDLAKGKEEIASIKNQYQAEAEKSMQDMEDAKQVFLDEYQKNLDIVANSRSELRELSASVTGKAEEALQKITEKQKELENFDISQIERYQQELSREIERIAQLKSEVSDQVARLDTIERSRYQLLIHYGGSDLGPSEPANFHELQEALYQKGYIVDVDDIMSVTADRQEIVYYSATADMSSKVEEIIELISPLVGRIGKKLERSGNNDPFQIVIKLCPGGTSAGLACKS